MPITNADFDNAPDANVAFREIDELLGLPDERYEQETSMTAAASAINFLLDDGGMTIKEIGDFAHLSYSTITNMLYGRGATTNTWKKINRLMEEVYEDSRDDYPYGY